MLKSFTRYVTQSVAGMIGGFPFMFWQILSLYLYIPVLMDCSSQSDSAGFMD